jgi:SIT family siderophore-iron:H+ symporter-like MFS transporter
MFAIIIPVVAIGLVTVMVMGGMKARRKGLMEGIPSSWRLMKDPKSWVHLFWVMDLIGLILLAFALGLILLPLALGGGSAAKWQTGKVIAPLVVGILLIPTFIIWEWKGARYPIFPSWAMRDRHILVVLLIQFLKSIGGSTRDAYLYFTLVVSFGQ